MRFHRSSRVIAVGLGLFALTASSGFGQIVPWDVFIDDQSDSVCDVVNAANAELVILSNTGQFVIVTGADVILEDTFVDINGDVFYLGDPAGFIDFALDGDGFRTLWWMSLTGRVVNVSGFTGEPTETDLLPSDFSDVPCDACDFWDDRTVCDPPITINFCGMNTQLSMALTAVGLGFMGLTRRRQV
ncbi:MAG: hypothetical protein JSU86_01265 [Phycisphaerales bacterium]|nr:MAG: hypothetical protein JSU86_01265 [Phycisphaerales bacterium]